MKRNTSIEFYRCGLMFGICLLHSITMAGHNTPWAGNLLQWCVPAFVFITGWFGIRFSFAKLIKLYGISIYCAAAFVCVDSLIIGQWGGVAMIYNIAINQWFLNAYVVVICFAPMVNVAVERMTAKHLFPIMLCAFGWSFATTLPIVSVYVPSTPGLTAYSFLTLLGVYVVARFLRRCYDTNPNLRFLLSNKRFLVLIVCACLFCAAIGLGDYNSPFAFAIASGTFLLAMRMKIPIWLSRICAWLGPTMFSVYLIHSHGYAWKYLEVIENGFLNAGFGLPFAYIFTATSVFCVCVVLDVPRRMLSRILIQNG